MNQWRRRCGLYGREYVVLLLRSTTIGEGLSTKHHYQWTSCLHACIYSIFAALETLCCSHLTCVLCGLSMCLIVSGIMRYHFHFDFLSLNLHPSIQPQRMTVASSGIALFHYAFLLFLLTQIRSHSIWPLVEVVLAGWHLIILLQGLNHITRRKCIYHIRRNQ